MKTCFLSRGALSIACVDSLVFVEFWPVGELFSTSTAFVRGLPSMCPHVSFQVCSMTKHFLTHTALIWLFTCVCSGVPLQSRPCGKSSLAKGTLKGLFPRMHSQMIFERRRICKLLPTVAARIRLLTCVNSHVFLHIHTWAEAFITDAAFVRLFPSMNPEMQVKIIAPVESVSANLAFERFLIRVNYFVTRTV